MLNVAITLQIYKQKFAKYLRYFKIKNSKKEYLTTPSQIGKKGFHNAHLDRLGTGKTIQVKECRRLHPQAKTYVQPLNPVQCDQLHGICCSIPVEAGSA